ncbi:hypothetical protein BRN38_21055, partial [Xanthomonas oryzae pv. oryzae]
MRHRPGCCSITARHNCRTPPKRREVCHAQHGPHSGRCNPPQRSLTLKRHHHRLSIGITAVYSAAYCA